MDRPELHFPVFVFLPGGDMSRPEYHLGISYIRAALRKIHGIASVQIVSHESAAGYVRAIIKSNPTLVGFAVYDNNFLVTSTLSRMLRESLPDVPIVFGGPTATFSAKECLRLCPWIDSCVAGEGEYTLPELMEHYMLYGRRVAPVSVSGVYYWKHGKVHYSGDRPLAGIEVDGRAPLDVLPSPYLSGILNAKNQAGILTSRGCIYKCTFCNFTSMSRFRVRYHSVELVLAEIEAIARMAEDGTQTSVYFYDDAFGLDLKRAKEIVQGIIDVNFADFGLRFSCLLRADRIDEDFIELIHKANFFHIGFGLESTDPYVLRLAKKVTSSRRSDPLLRRELEYIDSIREKVRLASKFGIETDVSVILGLPGDSKETAQKTLDDVHTMPCSRYVHNLLSVYPGTELFETHDQFGISIEKTEKGPPYITKHAFPVETLRFTDRSHISQISLRFGLWLSRIIANIASGGNHLSDVSPGIVSLLTWRDLVEHASFVRKTVSQLGTFFRLSGENERNFDARRDESVYCISSLCYFGTEQGEPLLRGNRATITLNSLRKYIVNFYPTLFIGPYTGYEPRSQPFLGGTGEKYSIRIGTFFDHNDINKLLDDLSSRENLQQALVEIASKCDFFMDSCKWAGMPCRGQNPSGFAVDEKGEERVCYSSPGFTLGTNVAEITNFMQAATKAAQKRRGCAECSIKDQCSCCPFPGPMSEEEFCKTSRELVRLKKFISMGPLGYSWRFML